MADPINMDEITVRVYVTPSLSDQTRRYVKEFIPLVPLTSNEAEARTCSYLNLDLRAYLISRRRTFPNAEADMEVTTNKPHWYISILLNGKEIGVIALFMYDILISAGCGGDEIEKCLVSICELINKVVY